MTVKSEALVLQLCERGSIAQAEVLAARWATVVPRSAFAACETDVTMRQVAFAPIRAVIDQEVQRLGLLMSQVVLFGFGLAGQRVLDLALCNALADVQAIVVDLPSDGVVVGLPAAQGAFRFVQHHRDNDPDGQCFEQTMHRLRDASLDIRTIVLPDEPAPTDRAIDAFVVELVARASRYQSTTRREVGVSSYPEDRA